MRNIKFRVWNKNRKMFIIDGMTPKEIQDDATQSAELPMMTDEDCVWQQYTGLKDKNDQEIYEGDIVRVPEGFMYPEMLSEITWDCGWYADNQKHNVHWMLSEGFSKIIKVVGNIFEGVNK